MYLDNHVEKRIHEENAYIQLIRDIHTKGEDDECRNGRVDVCLVLI